MLIHKRALRESCTSWAFRPCRSRRLMIVWKTQNSARRQRFSFVNLIRALPAAPCGTYAKRACKWLRAPRSEVVRAIVHLGTFRRAVKFEHAGKAPIFSPHRSVPDCPPSGCRGTGVELSLLPKRICSKVFQLACVPPGRRVARCELLFNYAGTAFQGSGSAPKNPVCH